MSQTVNIGYPPQRKLNEEIHATLLKYIQHGLHPGGFLSAVLNNDLKHAVLDADEENFLNLQYLCKWLYNYAPETCYGSPEKVKKWMEFVKSNNIVFYEKEDNCRTS
jgi:hypothetical protein